MPTSTHKNALEALAAVSHASPTAGSRVVIEHLESRALRDNPLGDPHLRPLPLYLPPGYGESGRRYPTVYFLAPILASGAMELNLSPFDESLPQRLDRLIGEGRIPPLIGVLPDPRTRYGGAQFLNSTATGRYSDYLLEIVEHVDRHYATVPEREQRALVGKSSGGYGALIHAMTHPELFGLIADHSGDKYFEHCYLPLLAPFVLAAERVDLEEVLRAPELFLHRGGSIMELFNLVNIPAMCAAYSPNPLAPLGFDLVVDLKTGELNEAVWQRWLRHDPVRLVDSHADALRSLRLLYLDAGRRDEFNLQLCARIFSARLSELNIDHRYEEFDGGHSRTQFRYDVSLEAIGQALAR